MEIAHIRTKQGSSETYGRHMKNSKDSKKAILQIQWTVTLHPLAERELMTIPADMQARFLHIGEMLVDLGLQLVGMPHIRPLESKLWEMRLTGRDGIARAVYAAEQERTLLVLHVFVKKTQTTPRSAIETALRRLKESI